MHIEDLKVVLRVAQLHSITAAAHSLDMSPATASATVRRVEKALGTELFVRTTRQLRLSIAGEKYLPQCEQALQMLEQARASIHDESDQVEGELRLAVSSDLGRNLVAPWLDEFMVQHPRLTLRLHVSDSNVDFYRDTIDMALRYGSPRDATLYGFRITRVPSVLCASQAWLDQHGVPGHPEDLVRHNGLFYQLQDSLHNVWTFRRNGQTWRIHMQGNRAANDGELVRRWCVAGKGIAIKSCLDVAEDLLAGKLVQLLPEYETRSTELWLICPSRQSITPAMRLLRDDLRRRCQAILASIGDYCSISPGTPDA